MEKTTQPPTSTPSLEVKIPEPPSWLDDYQASAWQLGYSACVEDLKQQLATAEQTGYERGVREAARESGLYERSAKCLRVDKSCEQAILNLLNKKGTE